MRPSVVFRARDHGMPRSIDVNVRVLPSRSLNIHVHWLVPELAWQRHGSREIRDLPAPGRAAAGVQLRKSAITQGDRIVYPPVGRHR